MEYERYFEVTTGLVTSWWIKGKKIETLREGSTDRTQDWPRVDKGVLLRNNRTRTEFPNIGQLMATNELVVATASKDAIWAPGQSVHRALSREPKTTT